MKYENIINEIKLLVEEGYKIQSIVKGETEEPANSFVLDYQDWYTKSLLVVKFLASDRYDEFKSYYEINTKRKSISTTTYVIQDYCMGVVLTKEGVSEMKVAHNINSQLLILGSLTSRVDSVLSNIELE